ncbi:MAG: DUF2849 domain-containing protein [Myxococcales bacterium]|jgi:hypothetical protein
MAKKPAFFVVSAARTDDGAPAYLKSNKTWSGVLRDAAVVDNPSVADELLQFARSQERQVCDPYVVKVDRDGQGAPLPVSARERIRADGPTTRLRRPDPA